MNLPFIHKDNSKSSASGNFKELIADVAKNGGGTIKLYRKDEETNGKFFVAEKDANDLKNMDPEQWIKNGYGGGNYVVTVEKENEKGGQRVVKDFRFSINGEPKEGLYESHKRRQADQEMATTITKDVLSFAKEMFPAKDDSVIVAMIQQQSQMMQLMVQQFMESQKNQMDTFMRSMENLRHDNPINETLEGIMQLSQVREMLTPNVSEDKVLEWAKLFIGSPITSGLMAKVAGIQIPEQKILPLAEIQAPGEKALGGPNAQDTTPSGKQEAVPHPTEKDDFESVMIDPIIDMINAKAEAPDIAQAIHQVINWTLSTIRVNIEPHPIMTEFIQAIIDMANGNLDTEKLSVAYTNFASNIGMPEELIEPVKLELIKLYMPMIIKMKSKQVIEGEVKDEQSQAV